MVGSNHGLNHVLHCHLACVFSTSATASANSYDRKVGWSFKEWKWNIFDGQHRQSLFACVQTMEKPHLASRTQAALYALRKGLASLYNGETWEE
jgi:hypothetical protein